MSQAIIKSTVITQTEILKSSESLVPNQTLSDKQAGGGSVSWNKVLSNAFKDPVKLLEYLEIDVAKYKNKIQTDSRFKMLVPLSYASKMKKGDWNDPLLRQVLPLKDELITVPEFVSDPVGDLEAEISPGMLHKYQGRVLLVTTGACPVHCRYCFRREFPYVDSIPDKKHWKQTLNKIREDESIHEIIFSGGDPLMLSDDRLRKMCKDIATVAHVETIRFHTRVPIFLPERITSEFLRWLSDLDVNKVMVIHSNHPNELDNAVGEALTNIQNEGVTLLNQAVLLKGINDSVDVLESLLKRLFSFQVLPYYLHQLDRVQGAAHFEVEKKTAIGFIEELRNRLPGYLVPRLVEEVSGERSKQAIVKIDE